MLLPTESLIESRSVASDSSLQPACSPVESGPTMFPCTRFFRRAGPRSMPFSVLPEITFPDFASVPPTRLLAALLIEPSGLVTDGEDAVLVSADVVLLYPSPCCRSCRSRRFRHRNWSYPDDVAVRPRYGAVLIDLD